MKLEACKNLDIIFSSVGFLPMKAIFHKEPQMINSAQNEIKLKCLIIFSFPLHDYLPWEASTNHQGLSNCSM